MSTVWRPVGPHEPRVYWLRRGVFLAVLVVLIVVLVEVWPSGGASKPPKKHQSGPAPSTSTSTSTSPPPTTAAVAACDPAALKLVLSTGALTYPPGQAATLIGKFRNPTTSACKLTLTPAHEVWTVKSGTDLIWTTHGCPSSDVSKSVTIKAGAGKSVSTTWDGFRLDSGCAKGPVALNGEYTLHATLDGVTGREAVFHVSS